MSLFGSLTTAISGLAAQGKALGHVSDNVANSQTIGFKRMDTTFVDYITQSSQVAHSPGTVVARPDYTNTVQGTVEQTQNPLALAIGGQGFFSVAAPLGVGPGGKPVFDDRQFFTRAGDFAMDKDGYLVNGPGYMLQGWPAADAAGNPDRTTLQPIRITQQSFSPIATSRVELAANLAVPAPSATPAPITTQASVYDTLGGRHVVNLTFTPTAANTWTLDVDVPDEVGAPPRGLVEVRFAAGAPPARDGTLAALVAPPPPGGVAVTLPLGDKSPAEVTFTTNFGQGPQTITLNLGTYGLAQGLTQYSDRAFSVSNLTQDGVPLGAYAGTAVRENGDVAVNYDNGQSRVIARVPLVAFSDPDKLQRLDGQAFMRTMESGEARVTDASSNGAGKLIAGSVERSNVDIASEFTKLIVAQRAYTANTRIVTATDEMLQDTINMRR